MANETGATIETDRKALEDGKSLVELWMAKIKRAKKLEEDWRKEVDHALDVYEGADKANVSFNIYNSNIQTILPAVYNSTPVPDVRRKFGDADPIAKQVSDVAERLIIDSVDQYDFDSVMRATVLDALATGRGVPRVRYTPYLDGDNIQDQETTTERVKWDRYIEGPADSWERVPWQAFEHDLTRDEILRLNPELGEKIKLTGGEELSENEDRDPTKRGLFQTAKVFEVWDKESRSVLFITDCYPEAPIKQMPDPLGLPEFFPGMKPLQIMTRPRSRVPVCPYNLYKHLIEELDRVTKRIAKLVGQLRVRGGYDAEMGQDFELIMTLDDGQFKPIMNVTQFAASGGLKDAIWVWPMEPVVAALQQLYVQRDQIKATIYEVTGISDIVRGASNANETATAQTLKSQWGSLRIQNLQAEVATVARNIFRSKIAIMANHYTDEMIAKKTNLPQTEEQAQLWPQVMEVFRSDMRDYRVDIETDSTIRADMTRNQEQMNMFLAGTAQFAQAAAGAAAQFGPGSLPVMAEVYTAFARKFKLGKQAEDALDKLSQMAQEAAQAPPEETPPDPAVQKAEAEMQVMQAKAQMEGQSLQAKAAHDQQMAALEMQKMQLDIQIKQIDLEIKKQTAEIDMQTKLVDAEMKSRDRQEAAQFGREKNAAALDAMRAKQQNGASAP
jgi:hypothetical protein